MTKKEEFLLSIDFNEFLDEFNFDYIYPEIYEQIFYYFSDYVESPNSGEILEIENDIVTNSYIVYLTIKKPDNVFDINAFVDVFNKENFEKLVKDENSLILYRTPKWNLFCKGFSVENIDNDIYIIDDCGNELEIFEYISENVHRMLQYSQYPDSENVFNYDINKNIIMKKLLLENKTDEAIKHLHSI